MRLYYGLFMSIGLILFYVGYRIYVRYLTVTLLFTYSTR